MRREDTCEIDPTPLGRIKKFKEKISGESGDRPVLSHLVQVGRLATRLF